MKKTALYLAAALLAFSTAAAQTSTWSENYDKALAEARTSGKTLLVDFTGSDWCPWCIKLDKEVFSQKAFKDYAAGGLVLMKADFPRKRRLSEALKKQNQELADRFGVQGFPTVILLNGKGGKIAETGYRNGGAEAYVTHLKSLVPKAPPKAAPKTAPKAAPKAAPKTSGPSVWSEDFDKSLAEAKASGKTLLVDFTGSDWCPWCIKLQKEVFGKKEFQDYAAGNLVLMMADFPRDRKIPAAVQEQNRKLSDRFGVEGYPTVILLNGKGEKIAETGYQDGGAAKYVEHLKSLISSGKK
jgi:protein disulfide-isomerase